MNKVPLAEALTLARMVQHPKALTFKSTAPRQSDISLIVHGQGVLIFNASAVATLTLYQAGNPNMIRVEFTEAAIRGEEIPSGQPLIDTTNNKGLHPGAQAWLSIDAQNGRISAGVGEARVENTLYRYQLTKAALEPLTHLLLSDSITPLRLLRDPITHQVPLIIRPTDTLTMNDIAGGKIVAKSHLSTVAQKLFNSVSGTNFVLDDPSFPDFSKAVEYSIANPHGWCNKRLAEKSREFDKDHPNLLETYLRITIGENNGESPGIPYVMEIWPPQHFSPVHNHGGANAIIRVLHGKINVSLYSHLAADVTPFAVADFAENDITWLSPTLNQVHKLENIGTQTCITIQCYLYDEGDNDHYDYFDYLDSEGRVQQYEPDSDMDFVEFKARMKQEWDSRPAAAAAKPWYKKMLCRA
jgi:hypothetical protein